MTVRSLPKRTAMQMVDLRDQLEGPYILSVITEGGHRYSMYVSRYVINGQIIEFYNRTTLVLALPIVSMWTLIHVSTVALMDIADVAKMTKTDQDARDEMIAVLYPDEAKPNPNQPNAEEPTLFPGETQPFPNRLYR